MAKDKGVSLDDVVNQLASLPPEQQQQVLSQMPPEAREQVIAHAKGKSDSAAPKQEKPKKVPLTPAQMEEKYLLNPARKLDGFIGSFITSGATTYGTSLAIPMAITGLASGAIPMAAAGLTYGAVLYLSSKLFSTAAWNIAKYPVKLSYEFVRHPIKTPLNMVAKVLSMFTFVPIIRAAASGLWDKIKSGKAVDDKPSGFLDSIFKLKNKSNLGSTLGGLSGALLGLNNFYPDLYNKIVDGATSVVPVVQSAYDGAANGLEKTVGLATALKDTGLNYYHSNLQPSY